MRTALALALASICSAAAIPACSTHQHATQSNTERGAMSSPVAFLTGHWRHDDGETVMEEIWFPPHPTDGASAGILRWTADNGTVRMYELMSLTPADDGSVAFQLRHFRGDMQPWASETNGPFRGVADRPGPAALVIRGTERNGDVVSITYERTGDALVSTLRFAESSGRDPIVIDFELVR